MHRLPYHYYDLKNMFKNNYLKIYKGKEFVESEVFWPGKLMVWK